MGDYVLKDTGVLLYAQHDNVHKEYDGVENDGIYHYEEYGNVASKKLIMSKDAFVEAFNKFCK